MILSDNTDPKKQKNTQPKDINRETLDLLAWSAASTGEKYNPYAYESYTRGQLSKEALAHRDVIMQEAVERAAHEGFIQDREGNMISIDDLDKDRDGNPLFERTTGYTDTAKSLNPDLNDLDAQDQKEGLDAGVGWIPIVASTAESISYKKDGFVPVYDKKLGTYVLRQTGLSRKDLHKVTDKVMDIGGPMEKNKSSFFNFFKSFYRGVDNIPSGLLNTATAIKDFTSAVFNATDMSAPGTVAFNPALFKSSPDNWIDNVAKNFNEHKSIDRSNYYMEDYEGAFDSAHSFSGALGQGLSSLVEFGGVGSLARKGTSGTLQYLMRQSAENTLKNLGQKYTKKQVDDLARSLAAKYGNTFGTYAGGMVVNTGHILESAQEHGLTDAEAATFALGVGAVSTLIEAKLGANELNNWLIGTRGGATKEIKNAILKETMGDMSGEAVNRVVKNKNVMTKIVDALSSQAQKFNQKKNIFSEGAKLYTAGRRSNKFFRTGLEEGTEEFLQSMTEKTGEFIFNNFFADLSDQEGDGMFTQRDLFDKKNFQEAFEEFAIGGIIGGSTGSLSLDKKKADRSLGELIVSGHTSDVLSVIESLKDTGHYTEDQYRLYATQVKEMDRIWQQKKDPYKESIAKSDMRAIDKNQRLSEAFSNEYQIISSYNSLQELEKEYHELKENNASEQELYDKQTEIKKVKASMYALERRSKSLQDQKRAKYSKELRDYEMDLNFRKDFSKQVIEELKTEIQEHKTTRSELDKGSKEYTTLTELIEKKQGTIKALRSGIKQYNAQIGNIKRKSFRNSFDQTVREAVDENMLGSELMTNHLEKGMRMVTKDENPAELRTKGFKVIQSPNGAFYTTANQIIKSEPKPEPKKEPETKQETTPETTPETKPVREETTSETEETFDPPQDLPDLDTYENLDGLPDIDLPNTEDLPDMDLDGKKPEQVKEPQSKPTAIFQVQRKGNGKYVDVIAEKFIDGMHVIKISEDGQISDVVVDDNWVLPSSKGNTSRTHQVVAPNLFETLFVHSSINQAKVDRAMRQSDFTDNLIFKFNDSFKRATNEQLEQGKGDVWTNESRVAMVRNRDFVDVEIWYKDVQIGSLENPYKFTYDGKPDGKPVILSEITFEEFKKDFNVIGGTSPEAFERLKSDQAALIELRKALNEYYNSIAQGREFVNLDTDKLPFTFSQRFFPMKESLEVPFDLQDTQAKNSKGEFVIWDKKRQTFLTDKKVGAKIKRPRKSSSGTRYKAYVEIGGVSKWIDIVPKQRMEDEKSYIDSVNKAMESLRALDPSTPLDSKKVDDLVAEMNNAFLALPLKNLYIKFNATKLKSGKGAGNIVPILEMYSTLDDSMDRMIYIDNSFKDLNQLILSVEFLSGIKVKKSDFKMHVAEDLEPSQDNAKLFTVNNGKNIFQPVFKLDFTDLDTLSLKNTSKENVQPETVKITNEDIKEDIPISEEDLMEFDGSLEDFDKMVDKFIDGKTDELPDTDIQFQRLKGISAFNSKYLTDWVAAQLSNYANDKVGKEQNIQFFIDKWVEGLAINNLGITKLDAQAKKYIINAKKEVKALDPNTAEGIYNRALIVEKVKKKFTASDLFSEGVMDQESAQEAENRWDWDNTMLPPKLSKMVKDVIAFTLYNGVDPYGRKAQTLINYPRVYEKLLHNLANTVDTDTQIARLKLMAKTDPEIAAVSGKIFKLDPDNSVYKGFFNQFKMFRLNYLQTVISDADSNLYNAIQKDPAQILLTRWKADHLKALQRLSEEDKQEIAEALELFVGYLNSFDMDQLEVLIEQMPKRFKAPKVEEMFYNIFSAMGIRLPIDYIKGVLKDKDVLDAYSDNEFLDGTTLGYIQEKIENLGTAKYKLFDEQGELGRFKTIANNAYQFSEDLYSKTFKDAEKNTRYPFVAPNFLIQTSYSLKQKGLKAAEKLGTESNYLIRLSKQTGEDVFKNLDFAYVGDIREEGKDGKVFKNLTEKDFLQNRHALFNTFLKEGKDMAYYQPFVIAEKRSSYGYKFPVDRSLARDGKPTAKAVDTFVDTIFKEEFDRIKSLQADKNKAKKYNSKKPFAVLTGLNNNPEFLKKVTDATDFDQIRVEARKAILPLLEQAIEDTVNDLKNFGVLDKMDQKLLEQFKSDPIEKDLDQAIRNYAAVFELNDMLVRASIGQIIQGDAAILKDEIDRVKRASGLNAAGLPVVKGTIRVAYKTDAKVSVPAEMVNRPAGESFTSDADDAIVFVTTAYRKRMEDDMGRLTKAQAEVYDKIIEGEELSAKELELVDLISAKTVYYTPEIYNKKSDFVLTKQLTSRRNSDGQWVAKKGMEKFHNMREWMEANEVEQLVTLNATKGIKNDAIEDSFFDKENFDLDKDLPMKDKAGKSKKVSKKVLDKEYFPSTELDGNYERLQVENKSKSAKGVFDITHPTQGIELIGAELQGEGAQELKDTFDKLRSEILTENVSIAEKYLTRTDKDGNLNIEDFITKAYQILEASEEREEVLKYLQAEDGNFKYNMNLPHLKTALEKMLVSHYNNGILRDKMPGAKVTIVPSTGINVVVDEDGNPVDFMDLEANPDKYDSDQYTTRPLKLHAPDSEGETAIAEIMITKRSADLLGLKPGDTIPDNALELFGVRIPSQWYHSMLAAKIVGFLPDTHGDIAALPRELPLIAGEDFDVDARFLMIKKGYWVKNEDGTKTYKLYGDAQTTEEKWDEYYRYNAARKEIAISVKEAMKSNLEYQKLKELRREFVEAIKSENSTRSQLYEQLVKDQEVLNEEAYEKFTSDLDTYDPNFKANYKAWKKSYYKDEIEFIGRMVEAIRKSKASTELDIENLKDLNDSIKMLETEMFQEAFKNYGLVPNFEEFKTLDTIDNAPVNVAANKNALVDTYIKMFKHHSIQDRLKVPASLDAIKSEADFVNSLWGNVDEKGKTLESTRMLLSSGGTFHAWRNNVTGASSIGNVAATNIVIAYATKQGLTVAKPIQFDGKYFDSFGVTSEEHVDDVGRVVESNEFKWDTISSLITAMTDNAKERLASKMNLIKVFVSPATIMSGLGIGKRRISLFFGQPVLRELNVNGDTSLYELEELLEDKETQILKKLSDYSKKNEAQADLIKENTKKYNINSADLIYGASQNVQEGAASNIDTLLGLDELSDEQIKFLTTQFKVIKQLGRVLNINSESFYISNILNTKKGFKDIDSAFKVEESYKILTGRMPQFEVFDNIKGVLNKDPMVNTYLKAAKTITRSWSKHLLSLSPKYRQFANDNRDILKTEGIEKLNTYVAMQAFVSTMKESGIDITKYDHLLYKFDQDKKTLKELFTELYNSSDEFADNEFVKNTYRGKIGGMDFIGIDSFTSMVPELRDAVATGFEELWNSDRDPREKQFARMALMYLIQKDNFEFRKDSFVSYIEPEMIKTTLDKLDKAHEDFKDNSNTILGRNNRVFFDQYLTVLAMTNKELFKPTYLKKSLEDYFLSPPKFDSDSRIYSIEVSKDAESLPTLGHEGPDQSFVPKRFIRLGKGNVFQLVSYDPDLSSSKFVYAEIPTADIGEFSPFHLTPDQVIELSGKLKDFKKAKQSENLPPIEALEDNIPEMDFDFEARIDAAVTGEAKPTEFQVGTVAPYEFDESTLPDIDLDGTSALPDIDPPSSNLFNFADLKKESKPDFKKELSELEGETTMEALFDKFLPDSPYKGLVKEMDSRGVKTQVVSSDMPAYGMYYPSNLIEINVKAIISDPDYTLEDLEETLVHEVLHAVVKNLSPASEQTLNEQLEKFVQELKPYIKDVKDKDLISELNEVLSDPREIVTYAFTSKRMAEFLANIDMDKPNRVKKTSFWTRLKDIIVSRVKKSLRGNKFDELVDIMDTVLDSNRQWLGKDSQASLSEASVVDRYNPDMLRKNKDKIYVFGDNTLRKGKKGQAVIRDEENAFGIATKFKPSTVSDAYFYDSEEEIGQQWIDNDIAEIKADGRPVVFPKDGIGTGLAKLKEKAPQTYAYLKNRLLEEFGFDNDTGEIVSQAQAVRTQIDPELLFDESFGLANDIFEIAGIDNFEELLRSGEIKFIDKNTKKPCLKHGGDFGFTPGGSWKIIKEFKGKSHAQGGIDINTKDL